MKTVLVADDDVITRKIVKQICQKFGYKVRETDNGEKAFRSIKRKPVDILITDWIMPERDGLSLCEKVHNEFAERAPFIFLITGKKKGLKNYAEALAAGADDFLYKPIDYHVFQNQLRAAEKSREVICR